MRPSILITTLIATLALTGVAMANIPDCDQSSFDVPAVLGRSPKNIEVGDPVFQYTLSFTLRNSAGQPLASYDRTDVTLEVLTPCQNPFSGLNPDACNPCVWGAALLDRPGGSCTGTNVVHVRIDTYNCDKYLDIATSPDEDGDNTVSLTDLTIFQTAFRNGGPAHQGDLNRSGGPPDLTDLTFFQRHFRAI